MCILSVIRKGNRRKINTILSKYWKCILGRGGGIKEVRPKSPEKVYKKEKKNLQPGHKFSLNRKFSFSCMFNKHGKVDSHKMAPNGAQKLVDNVHDTT